MDSIARFRMRTATDSAAEPRAGPAANDCDGNRERPLYDLKFSGTESIDGRLCYHLVLRPEIDPDRYPLRELWVDEKTFQVVRSSTSARTRRSIRTPSFCIVSLRWGPSKCGRSFTLKRGLRCTDWLRRRPNAFPTICVMSFPTSAPDWYFEP